MKLKIEIELDTPISPVRQDKASLIEQHLQAFSAALPAMLERQNQAYFFTDLFGRVFGRATIER